MLVARAQGMQHRVAPLPSFSEAVKPTRAADTLPMVTAMLSQARKVRSLAVWQANERHSVPAYHYAVLYECQMWNQRLNSALNRNYRQPSYATAKRPNIRMINGKLAHVSSTAVAVHPSYYI